MDEESEATTAAAEAVLAEEGVSGERGDWGILVEFGLLEDSYLHLMLVEEGLEFSPRGLNAV